MKIYKFGGASVKDAGSVKNVAMVLESQDFNECLLVISAMGKTTNELEIVVEKYFNKENYQSEIEKVKQKHIEIAQGLFNEEHEVFSEINVFFDDIDSFLRRNKSPNYSFVYDQVVSCGEMISTKIVSDYLNSIQFSNQWLDARDYIKTDDNYREGLVNWKKTEELISNLDQKLCYVTQGFIGSDENNFTVTLGREGSDYTAGIFAYCMNADSVTIWKDVPGVMTGDPRKFDDVVLLSNISYEEAIEMAYYGASVIHPKTLQPLKQKKIPFFVKSFVDPTEPGTQICQSDLNQKMESYILKENQVLMKISTRDFSFIAEDHMSRIFNNLANYHIKVSLMQNSAISLGLCLEDKYGNIDELVQKLNDDFKIEITKNVSLFTVRNADVEHLEKFYEGRNVLYEQLSQQTLQMVVSN